MERLIIKPIDNKPKKGSYEEWSRVWYILSALCFIYGFVFLVFGQAKPQAWAAVEPKDVPHSDQLLKA
ncbi:hypothetical protein ElyMa_003030200 [Elysia marginata]|uniref:Uncharacterized protein n=1 Tax=Elysia marginata TaxID=1093978 RepID=A0AAV4IHZ9_9GAST|nr:hypothetical protein ElyMa_003030200 [Elysia marginata]